MASYSYAGLRIPVQADTTGLERSIKTASATAANVGGKIIEGTMRASVSAATGAAMSQVKSVAKGMEQTFTKAGQNCAAAFAKATGTTGSMFAKGLSAALGGLGGIVAQQIVKVVSPIVSQAAKRTASQLFLEYLPELRKGAEQMAVIIGKVADAAAKAANNMAIYFSAAWGQVTTMGARALSTVQGAAMAAARAAGSAWRTVAGGVSAGWNAVVRVFSVISGAAGSAAMGVASAWSNVGGVISRALESPAKSFGVLVATARSAALRIAAAFLPLAAGGGGITSGFSRGFAVVASQATAVAGRIRDAFTGAFSTMGQLAARIASTIGGAFSGIAAVSQRAASVAMQHLEGLGQVGQRIFEALSNAFQAVADVITRVVGKIVEVISRAAKIFGKEFAVAAGVGADAFTELSSKAGEAGRSIGDKATAAASSLAKGFLDGGERAAKGVLGIVPAVEQVEAVAEQASSKVRGAFSGVASGIAKGIGSAATLAAGAVTGVGAAAVKTGITYNTLNQTARASFTTILGSGAAASKMMDNLTAFAKTSPFPKQAFISGTQQMLAFGVETKKVIPYLGAVQDAVAASGGNAQSLSEIVTVMGQIQAAGKITGTDLMQFAQHGINAADLIGSSMGKTGVQIKDQITNGSLDAGKALDALTKGMEKSYGGAAANVKNTWVGATDRVKGALRDIGSAIVEPFISKGGGGKAVEWANKLATLLRSLEKQVKPLVDAFMKGMAPVFDKITPMMDKLTAKVAGMNWKPITDGLAKFAPLIAGVGTALAGVFGGAVAGQIPIIGGLFQNLAAPVKGVGGALKGLLPEGLTKGLGGLGGTLGIVAGAFGLLMTVSPDFRAVVIDLGKQLMGALVPAIKDLMTGLKPLIPPIVMLVKMLGTGLANVIKILIPPLVQLVRMLGNTLAQAINLIVPMIITLVKMLGGVLAKILPVLGPLIGLIADAFMKVLTAVLPLVPVLIDFVVNVISALLPVLPPIITMFVALVKIILGMLPALMPLINMLLKLVTDVFMALLPILPPLMSLIIQVVSALLLLLPVVTALLPLFMMLINLILPPVIWLLTQLVNIIGIALVWAIKLLMPVLTAIIGLFGLYITVIKLVVGWVVQLWHWISGNSPGLVPAFQLLQSVLGTVASFISTVVVAAFNGIRTAVIGVFNAVVWVWNLIYAQTITLWTKITGFVSWAWSAIKAAVSAAVDWVRARIQQVWAAILAASQTVWNAILGFLRGIWESIKGAISGALNWLWARISQVWTLIQNTTGTIWNAIRGVITGAWNGIKSAVQAAGTWVVDKVRWVWDQIRNNAASAWGGIVKVIGAAWEGLKKTVGSPIFYVANSIIKPLISGINSLITKIKLPAIPIDWIGKIPHFAHGGKVPGGWGGGDRQVIMAEPGEWVLTKDQARAIGYSRLAGLPRYAEGGPVGKPPHGPQYKGPFDFMGDIGSAAVRITHVKDLGKIAGAAVDSFTGMLKWAAAQAFRAATEPIKKLATPYAAKSQAVFPQQWLGQTALTAIDGAITFIEGKSMQPCDAGGVVAHALQFDGKPYHWGGPANPSGGFDCSSFVSFIAGSAGLPLPGGFHVPSGTHGPVTGDYLSWSGMKTVGLGQTRPGDIAVNSHHIGFIIGPHGAGFAARSTATGIGHQSFASGYTYRTWGGPAAGAGTCDSGVGMPGPPNGFPVGVKNYAGLVGKAAAMLGISYAANAFLSQMASESGGNPKAINNWDSNARAGTPSKGLLQLIDPTFAAYAGPYRSRGIWDPFANIYAGMAYAKSRYGSRLTQVIGHGHGYATGGLISEHVVGVGQRSGEVYHIGERGPEIVTPLTGPGADAAAGLSGPRGATVVNVYPREQQSEVQIAAAVSRALAWAQAGGTP